MEAGSPTLAPAAIDGPNSGRRILAAFFALAGAAAAILIALRDPARGGYPTCPLHDLTGWQCAGCGTLRAVHEVAHGHLAAAFRLNAPAVLFLPVGIAMWVNEARVALGRRAWRLDPRLGRWAWLVPAAVLIFFLARNVV
jgi:hypothetical protein